ncbi:DgyrCDS3342 [Dimorphilus gyrociliatus]|uniref:Multifunctional fusion protein n=1 Tax=Dimorphilus gyrociliatus TaxID=2664684 RepID=A0A7I8VE16_9ANNE|nr:DgyrCDS3342 [Dimorphilus gyrociliatus]
MINRISSKENIPCGNDKPQAEVPEKRFKSDSGNDVPRTFKNLKKDKIYKRGNFLGKGGFARCYEATPVLNGQVSAQTLAIKVVRLDRLAKKFHRQKMYQEIEIHSKLSHPNIIGFYESFSDSLNVYIVLELCKRRSLMELQKRRITVTEPETRYFSYQIAQGLTYLHGQGIIHRDLKLGNILLNENLEVKIGDFGLATHSCPGQMRKSLCGTPNYIAPEILNRQGHDFKVDSWSLGCVIYTLLFGKPPFERSSLKETYESIQDHRYSFPDRPQVGGNTRRLINQLLLMDPLQRLDINGVLCHTFYTSGYHPSSLPDSCLTIEPRFDQIQSEDVKLAGNIYSKTIDYLSELFVLLNKAKKSPVLEGTCEELQSPEDAPIFWLAKWVDYTDKYGFGAMLCDGSVCIKFNDSTRLITTRNCRNLQYVDANNKEELYTINNFPQKLNKKVVLAKYFKRYMEFNLKSSGPRRENSEASQLSRLPSVKMWFRTRRTTVFYLSNHTFQANFNETHDKVILCPLLQSITIIDQANLAETYKLSTIIDNGCCTRVLELIRHCVPLLEQFLNMKSRSIFGLDNGLARTPPMGWISWERFRCNIDCTDDPNNCISENLYMEMADVLSTEGYSKVGYEYVNIDDCWLEKKRDDDGRLVADRKRFPRGIRFLADYMHSRQLKLGIYEDFGVKTCAGYPGSEYFLQMDAQTFADWKVDMLKLDGCNSLPQQMDDGYPPINLFLNKTKRPILLSVEYPFYQLAVLTKPNYPLLIRKANLARNFFDIDDSWDSVKSIIDYYASDIYNASKYAQPGFFNDPDQPNYKRIAKYCNIWRNYNDVADSWRSILSIIEFYGKNKGNFSQIAKPGSFNDPDMLILGNFGLSYDQERVQMAMWCIMASPLFISADLRKIRASSKELLLNKYAISINQDPLGIQGTLVEKVQSCKKYRIRNKMLIFQRGDIQIWQKELQTKGSFAFVYLKTGDDGIPSRVSFKMSKMGALEDVLYMVYEVFENKFIGLWKGSESFEAVVNPTGVFFGKAFPA